MSKKNLFKISGDCKGLGNMTSVMNRKSFLKKTIAAIMAILFIGFSKRTNWELIINDPEYVKRLEGVR